ncbi:MAG: hypothetical protein JNK75_10455 [Betaproteobacteria bacterium]|nr:hypothetical protein [Betaproteobacteria bacterium]
MILKPIAGLVAAALPALALAQSDARAISAKDAFASPVLVVAPKPPARSASDAASVEVRVTGSIGTNGILSNPVFENAQGKDKYVQAIREVLHLWRFKPAVDLEACKPAARNGTVVVWFDDKGGKSSVAVSMPQVGGKAEAARAGGEGAIYKVAQRPRAIFPQEARDIGAEGAAEVLVKLNDKGDNVQQTLLYATPHSMFGESAMARAGELRIAPNGSRAQCVAVPYHFCMDGDVSFPNSACEGKRSRPAS